MAYRNRFYPPEFVDWDDEYLPREMIYICNPVCCPNPYCYPQSCVPSTNFATCCPNPNSIYNTSKIVTACSPGCSPDCNPRGCNPRGYYHHQCGPHRRLW